MMQTDNPSEPIGRLLPWDTQFFGFRIGRLSDNHLNPAQLDAVLHWAQVEKIRCLYFFGDAECPETLSCASQGGFKFVDLRMELNLRLTSEPAANTEIVTPASHSDLPGIEALSRISHRDTRFFKDTEFPLDRSGDLYAAWIQRDFDLHHILVVKSQSGRIVGYITCQTTESSGTGQIGLVAVADTERRRGLGRTLVATALHWFYTRGCIEVKVVTQASNVAAQRVYQALGFRTAEANATFHRWFPVS